MTDSRSRRLVSPLWVLAAVIVSATVILMVVSLTSGAQRTIEELLLDEFPRHRAPSGMAALTTLSYIGMLIAVGVAYFRILVPGFANEWSLRVTYGASAMAVIAMLLLVPVTKAFEEERETIFAIFDLEMWNVSPGHGTIRALIFTVVGLAFMLFFLERDLSVRRSRFAALAGGLFALGAFTVVGHTATLTPAYIIHGADFMHTLAASFWVGGLIALIQYLWSAMQQNDRSREFHKAADSANVIAKFSALALWSFAILVTSGVIMGWIVAGNPLDIIGNTYLNLLLAKLGVLVVPAAMAVWNRFWLVPAVLRRPEDEDAWRFLRRAIVIEILGVLTVLFITGYLVLQNPEA